MYLSGLFLLVVCVSYTLAAPKWNELEDYTFEQYEVEFGKHYSHRAERQLRKELFEKRLAQIREHNSRNLSWKEGVNHLTDRSDKEFKAMRGGIPNHTPRPHPHFQVKADKEYNLEELELLNVDWREKGIITAVKDQGGCGSCWSFATAEVVESYYALSTGILSALSEQQILDCTPNPDQCGGTGGCGGGTAQLAFARIQQMGGLATEWTYPYVSYFGQDQKCKFDPSNTPPFANISDFYTLPQNKYAPLLEHIATKGPVAISVDASAWQYYEGGVFDGCNQTNPDLDHAVLLVGYGTDAKLGPYWLIRNSWGPKWGELGYIRIKRQNEEARCGEDLTPKDGDGCADSPPTVKVCGTCGILYDNCYPDVVSPKSSQ
eukprot:TRINITY_DN2163_c0_g1_i1.p1 TRINITY_DN2163_c0_g1~~TRINITY_DN2163_c0_g1_i1.p1  ORF type:complete len:389 (-),score=97.59 TRINITY_DN2163_c0_g1_i1:35-1162(-)